MGLFEAFDKVSHQDWMDKITVDLKGKDFQETLVWNSDEGIDVRPFYDNGSYSYIPIKRSSHWEIRETVVIDSFEVANKEALSALKGGANAILFVGEVSNQDEMNQLLKGIQTNIIAIHFYNSSPKHTLQLIALNEGSISYDYLGEFLFSGKWRSNKEDDIDELAALTNSSTNIRTISINGNYYPNAGYSLIQEISFSLSQAVEYFNILTDKGIDPKTIATKIQFSFGIGTNYFFEIAKIRAIRKLWKIILQQFEVADVSMSIHAETVSLTPVDEDKNYNILRNTTMAMSAIIGGCDSLTILPHDTTDTAADFSKRIARNIQHILKEEAFFDKVTNPADGAYYIEQLTDEIAKKSWALFQEVEEQGGFLFCAENKLFKK